MKRGLIFTLMLMGCLRAPEPIEPIDAGNYAVEYPFTFDLENLPYISSDHEAALFNFKDFPEYTLHMIQLEAVPPRSTPPALPAIESGDIVVFHKASADVEALVARVRALSAVFCSRPGSGCSGKVVSIEVPFSLRELLSIQSYLLSSPYGQATGGMMVNWSFAEPRVFDAVGVFFDRAPERELRAFLDAAGVPSDAVQLQQARRYEGD